MTVRFDDSLALLVDIVEGDAGADVLEAGTILRDTSGRLTFFARTSLPRELVSTLSQSLRSRLGSYAAPEEPLIAADAFGADTIASDASALLVRVSGHTVRLVDRRLVGADWLRAPAAEASPPPRYVFASLKGGVGRSTALCVAAAHLAAQGARVLAIDLDLEAPGLGALLLSDATRPRFGIIDALVEDGLGGLDATFLQDLRGPSALATRGGKIDVVPALGSRSYQNPAEVLAKLARAYAEDITESGATATILDQIRALVDRLAEPSRYDAILIDARAGLHEASAAAIIGLGAEVFLFGRHEEQTFQGYSFLLAHLARLIGLSKERPEWIERITPVHALASTNPLERERFIERWDTMVRASGLLPTEPISSNADVETADFQGIEWTDDVPDEAVLPLESSLLVPIAILRSSQFDGFDPLQKQDALSASIYVDVFGEILQRVVVAGEIVAAGEHEKKDAG